MILKCQYYLIELVFQLLFINKGNIMFYYFNVGKNVFVSFEDKIWSMGKYDNEKEAKKVAEHHNEENKNFEKEINYLFAFGPEIYAAGIYNQPDCKLECRDHEEALRMTDLFNKKLCQIKSGLKG